MMDTADQSAIRQTNVHLIMNAIREMIANQWNGETDVRLYRIMRGEEMICSQCSYYDNESGTCDCSTCPYEDDYSETPDLDEWPDMSDNHPKFQNESFADCNVASHISDIG